MRPIRNALFVAVVLVVALVHSAPVLGQIGVGVSLGRIVVDDPLRPGGIYRLPSVAVINTGEERSTYEMALTYHQGQKQRRPPREWVSFAPKSFTLEPGESQLVSITLSIPANAWPGEYFAYLEAGVVAEQGGFAVGVAAATKLYFSVQAATRLAALSARVSSLVEINAPYSYIIPGVAAFVGLVVAFWRYSPVRLKIERRQ